MIWGTALSSVLWLAPCPPSCASPAQLAGRCSLLSGFPLLLTSPQVVGSGRSWLSGRGHWREACVGSVEDMGAHTHFLFLTPGRSHSDCACWSESLPRPGRCRCGLGKLFQEGYVTCLLANKWQSWDLNPGPEFPACSSLSSVPPSPSLDIRSCSLS